MNAERLVYHFSEDPGIETFVPHVPPTNPTEPASVWAIGSFHQPLYWFPRDCPRGMIWFPDERSEALRQAMFATGADRVCVVESAWLERLRTVSLYRYAFPADEFEPWPEADGQFVAHQSVAPTRVEPIGDLLALHAANAVELRVVPSMQPFVDAVLDSGLQSFSFCRLSNLT